MPKEVLSDSSFIRKQTSGEQAWASFLSLLFKFIDRARLRVPETLVFGWGAKKPVLLYTDETGVLRGEREVSLGFVTTFLTYCSKEDQYPLCVGRQLNTFAVNDAKTAMTLWHKNVAVSRAIYLQRYVSQRRPAASLVRVLWKPQGVQFVTLTNIIPYAGAIRRRSVIALGRIAVSVEDRVFTRAEQASMSTEITRKRELESAIQTLANMYKSELKDQHTQLSELVAEFIQENSHWFLIRVVSYEISKSLGSSVPELTHQGLRMRNRSWNDGQYQHLSIKRMSETILSLKQSLGMAITQEDRQRLASYTDFSVKLRKPLPRLNRQKTRNLTDDHNKSDYLIHEPSLPAFHSQSSSMPPLFQFPTPRENESFHIPQVEEIKEHIRRQNNSLYTRIHYQEPMQNQNLVSECVKRSISFGAGEFDRLRELGIEGRDLLKSREGEVFHAYTIPSESSVRQ